MAEPTSYTKYIKFLRFTRYFWVVLVGDLITDEAMEGVMFALILITVSLIAPLTKISA